MTMLAAQGLKRDLEISKMALFALSKCPLRRPILSPSTLNGMTRQNFPGPFHSEGLTYHFAIHLCRLLRVGRRGRWR
jgi:hypothetical protein